MAEPLYPNEHLFDPTLGIKLEPGLEGLVSSASVPIPNRRMPDAEYTFELNADPFNISSPLVSNDNTFDMNYVSDITPWSRDLKIDTFRMDEEDIFQVEKSDLIQGPTLAELNASEDELLSGDLTFDGLMLPGDQLTFNVPSVTMLHVDTPSSAPTPESVSPMISQTHLGVNPAFIPSSFPPACIGYLKDSLNISSSVPQSSAFDMYLPKPVVALSPDRHSSPSNSPVTRRHSTLHELLMKREPLGRSMPAQSPPLRHVPRQRPSSRLSSSAPTQLGMDQIWQRREPRQHLLSTGSMAEGESVSSLSTIGILSPESHFSLDDLSDSDEESDHHEVDDDTDGDSSDGEGGRSSHQSAAKKERFFWQYNVQAKGPKGQRLVLKTKQVDPHFLNEVTDPVFSPSCSVRGIKHSGKARKGDGNDLTPNPKKLQIIGKELEKLNKVINDITPVSELPFNIRPKTRKEKNKLASRACRLKKKAQHEANKIKLHGLDNEHKKLITGIQQMKQLLVAKVNAEPAAQEELTRQCEKAFKAATKVKIADHSTEYVNRVLERLKNGVPDGGLGEF